MVAALLSGSGLALDIIGVFLLFFNVDKAFKPIFKRYAYFDTSDKLEEAVEKINRNLDKIIEDTNKKNEAVRKKNKCFFGLIVVGFLLQFIALFFQTASQ